MISTHRHPEPAWPLGAREWDTLAACSHCGIEMLRVFIRSATWVLRRVEKVTFLDDRTVHRQVSVDYALPEQAIALRRPDGSLTRVVPLTMMRRKSLINFDLRDEDDRSIPLLGLRQTQALTLSVAREWARRTLRAHSLEEELEPSLDAILVSIVRGDQKEMHEAYEALKAQHPVLWADDWFTGLMDRLAGNFVPFTTDDNEPGTRRIVKFSYDEPLTLRYAKPTYLGHEDPEGRTREPVYGGRQHRLAGFEPAPLLAGLGLRASLIRFPVPSAELAGSYHFEITAPPEVSIVEASLLAGLPTLYLDDDPARDRDAWERRLDEQRSGDGEVGPALVPLDDERLRRRPSFDSVGGGYPTVDLHVVDVPYGSLSRAQVKLRANSAGWLSTATTGALMATATLAAAYAANLEENTPELATVVLATFAAALVAALVRPDPHRMVTRLLTLVRGLATLSALFTLAGAIAFAFFPGDAHAVVGWLALASVVPAALITLAFALARWSAGREARRPRDRLSPWEQYAPGDDDAMESGGDFHVELAGKLERADYPFDAAVRELHFDRPAIKVASSEGARREFPWTREFRATFYERLLT